MTQALLNNLNTTQENSISFNDNRLKDTENEFDKILSITTSKNENESVSNKNIKEPSNTTNNDNTTVVDNVNDVQNIQESKPTAQNKAINTEQSPQEIESDDLRGENNILAEEINNTIKECAIETVIDLTIIENVFNDNNDNEKLTDNTEYITNENSEDIDSENNNITEETVTDEDSTMNKELNTLKNPTAAMLINSQIQTTTKNVTKNDYNNSDNKETNVGTNTKSSNNNNLTEFKQFESNISKDSEIISTNSKDIIQSKPEKTELKNTIDAKIVKELNIKSINTELADNQSPANDLMQNQSPEEQAAKVLIQGDIKIERPSEEFIKTTIVKPTEIPSSKIIEQISKHLEGMYNNSKVNIVLNPEALGKVNLQIINSKDGIMAQFTVTTQEARDILIKGLDGLKHNLLSHGINIDNVSVKLDESNDSEYQPDWTEQEGSKEGNKHQDSNKKQKKDEKPFEQMMFELNNNDNV